jgi:hypothetical protein
MSTPPYLVLNGNILKVFEKPDSLAVRVMSNVFPLTLLTRSPYDDGTTRRRQAREYVAIRHSSEWATYVRRKPCPRRMLSTFSVE